jgi:hypothetical protein
MSANWKTRDKYISKAKWEEIGSETVITRYFIFPGPNTEKNSLKQARRYTAILGKSKIRERMILPSIQIETYRHCVRFGAASRRVQ